MRCPLCGETYPLDEILGQLPPTLEVVSESIASLELPTIDDGQAAAQSTLGEELPADSVVARTRPLNVTPVRRKDMSHRGVVSLVKIVLGGFAGLLLGQLILWWLPMLYRTDPLRLARALPKPLAFLAPEMLRGSVMPAPRPSLDGAVRTADAEDSLGVAMDAPEVDDVPSPSPSPSATMSTPSSVPPSTQSAKVVLGLADAPRFDIPTLEASLREAKAAWLQSGKGETSFEVWYEALQGLAYRVTFADTSEAQIGALAGKARSFLREIAADPSRLDRLGAAAGKQLAADNTPDRQGTVVAGTVVRVSRAGRLFQSDIKLFGAPAAPLVPVISRANPTDSNVFRTSDAVFVVGVVVQDPSLHLLGYNGDSDVVVLGGLPIKIPR